MRVEVLLFGPEAVAAGSDRVMLEFSEPPTCLEVRTRLWAAHPELRPFLPASRFAVNAEFAVPGTVVGPGDELALIGMVSGG